MKIWQKLAYHHQIYQTDHATSNTWHTRSWGRTKTLDVCYHVWSNSLHIKSYGCACYFPHITASNSKTYRENRKCVPIFSRLCLKFEICCFRLLFVSWNKNEVGSHVVLDGILCGSWLFTLYGRFSSYKSRPRALGEECGVDPLTLAPNQHPNRPGIS